MKVVTRAFGVGLTLSLSLAMTLLGSRPVFAQKILHIEETSAGIIVKSGQVDEAARVTRGLIVHRKLARLVKPRSMRFSYLAVPDQTLFPPYYRFPQPYAKGPGMTGRIMGGPTSRQGSKWRSAIRGGRTARQGAPGRSHIKGGRTVEGGSQWASHIIAGKTAGQGSPFASTIPNGRLTGYSASVRTRAIGKFGLRRTRSLWASRLR